MTQSQHDDLDRLATAYRSLEALLDDAGYSNFSSIAASLNHQFEGILDSHRLEVGSHGG